MDNLKDNTLFNTVETVLSESAEQSIDTQINLPEYCSDIRKILKCFVVPNIFACSISGDRVNADGEAVIRVLYTGEGGKLECYEQSVPFSKYAQLGEYEGDLCVKPSAKTEYVNCRAASQRRISVSASISVKFCVTCLKKERLTAKGEEAFETLCESVSCSMPVALTNKPFDMSETAVLEDSDAPVACIIRTDTHAVLDSVKTIADKMLIKGDMVTDVLYCTDSDNGTAGKYRHSMPISQIIDLDGADEDSLCSVDIKVLSSLVSFKADSEGKNTLLDISVKAIACVNAYDNHEVEVVCDAYSTEYETAAEYKNMFFKNHLFTYRETKQLRENFDMSSLSLSEIIDVFACSCDGTAQSSGESTVCRGETAVGILCKNSEGEYAYTEKTLEFDFDCAGKMTAKAVSAKPEFTVTDISGKLSSGGNVEIGMTVLVTMPVFEECEKKVCVRLETDESRVKAPCDCPLTVFFSSSGEKIWDIAKRYNTTSERIREDNDISGDEIEEKTLLLISSV